MKPTTIFSYYGGKTQQLSDILKIMKDNIDKFETVVDVFGGSGRVILSIPPKWKKMKVYNDLNKSFYVVFKGLQNENMAKRIGDHLEVAFHDQDIFEEYKNDLSDIDLVNSLVDKINEYSQKINAMKKDIYDYMMETEEGQYWAKMWVDYVVKVIYIYVHSYSGVGQNFGRIYNKYGIWRYGHEQFPNLVHKDFGWMMKSWTIHSMDFRELMKLYNHEKVLLYIDPPYLTSGKKVYRSSNIEKKYLEFELNDFYDLKTYMDDHKGSYILNLSLIDKEMIEIFGEPTFITEHIHPRQKSNKYKMGWWVKFPESSQFLLTCWQDT